MRIVLRTASHLSAWAWIYLFFPVRIFGLKFNSCARTLLAALEVDLSATKNAIATTMYATVLFHHNIVVVHFFFLFTKIHVQTIKVHTEMCECVLVYECDACKLLYCRIVVAIAILALWLHLFGYWQQLSVIAAQWLIIWKIFVKCFVFVVELYGSAGKQCNCHDQRTIKLLNCSCKL